MDVINNYRKLLDNSKIIFDDMIAESGSEYLISSHNYLLDYDKFKIAISNRPEVAVLDLAVKEYQFSLFALAAGQYRHAFGGLRLFFELMLSTVQFSAHEIDFRMWNKDEKDINWSSIISSENGVFSKNFIRAFNPDFSENGRQYLAIAERVYRECSEFVHGNATTHKRLPLDLKFHKETFNLWHEKSTTMRLVIIFALSARYLNHIGVEEMNTIEPVVIDALGNLKSVQEIFSKPLKAE
ncbi:hypothetical protein ACRRRU_03595 [Dickeya fangzhongdai]|uniref:hypothetical protein n=1 Tax=Dickeya fangzhongdai TaxID=1778540 RepID=UPI0013C460EE|nr:hypothetical protein [Dickeya fangzhongdai]